MVRIVADLLFFLHGVVLFVILFGWAFASIWLLYVVTLVHTLLSLLVFGYCILSKWEFDLRKKLNPALHYDYSFVTFYTYKFTEKHISKSFVKNVGFIFLTLSLFFAFYFR